MNQKRWEFRGSKFETIHFFRKVYFAAFGGGTKGFGGRIVSICPSKLKQFCPQKTIFRHVAERSDGISENCMVLKVVNTVCKWVQVEYDQESQDQMTGWDEKKERNYLPETNSLSLSKTCSPKSFTR